MRWRSAVVAGGLAGMFAVGCTGAYLASIEIDDGLEALIVVPLICAAMVIIGVYGAVRRAGSTWVVRAAIGATVPILAVVIWTVVASATEDESVGRLGGNTTVLVAVAGLSTVGFVFGLACAGGCCGWGAAELVRALSVRRRRRAGDLG